MFTIFYWKERPEFAFIFRPLKFSCEIKLHPVLVWFCLTQSKIWIILTYAARAWRVSSNQIKDINGF